MTSRKFACLRGTGLLLMSTNQGGRKTETDEREDWGQAHTWLLCACVCVCVCVFVCVCKHRKLP